MITVKYQYGCEGEGLKLITIFNSESLWIGTDLKQFNTIRDKLAAGGVPYKYKVKNQLGQSRGVGTTRGNMGSFGTPSDQMYQYEILVYRKDLDKARYILGRS